MWLECSLAFEVILQWNCRGQQNIIAYSWLSGLPQGFKNFSNTFTTGHFKIFKGDKILKVIKNIQQFPPASLRNTDLRK